MGFVCDNAGQRTPPHPQLMAPVPAGGITKLCTSANTNYTVAVEAGESYQVTANYGTSYCGLCIYLSITGDSTINANKEWVFNLGESILITIPVGITVLNMSSSRSNLLVYLSKLQK